MTDLKSTVRVSMRVNTEAFWAAADELEADIKKAVKKFNKSAHFTLIEEQAQPSSFDRLGRVL